MRIWLVYIRKSVVRDETDLESPERQLYVCKARLTIGETQPYETEIYQDLDRSGSTESGRPEWLRLKEQLSRPEVVGVIASSLDRLYRNVSEFLAFLKLMDEAGKALITAKESLDTTSPLGRFVVTILMALFEMEWRLTSYRMTEMIEDKRRRQGRHWGVAPFGCGRDGDGQLIPSPETFIVRGEARYYHDALAECFRLYAMGDYSYEQVADILNKREWRFYDPGHKAPVEWDKERVRGVVNRWRLYRGDLPMGNPLKARDVEWIRGGHQPILPVELCAAVGTVLGQRGRRGWSKVAEYHRTYLLSDVLFCSRCGIALNGQFWNNRRLYRHKVAKGGCPEVWIRAETIEQELTSAMLELAYHPELFEELRAMAYQLEPKQVDNRPQLETLQERLNRLEELYILKDEGISKEGYLKWRNQIIREMAELEAEQKQDDNSSEVIEQILLSFHNIQRFEDKEQKFLINDIFKRVEVLEGQIQALVPQDWAEPFFGALRVVYGPGGSRTRTAREQPILVQWFINATVER